MSFPTFTECPGPSLPLLPCRLHSQRQGARICRLVSHIRKTWKHRLYVVLAIVPASASGQQRVRMGEPGGPIYQVETMAIEPRPQRCFAIPRSHCGAASDAIGLPIVFRSIEPGSQDPRRLSPSSTLFGARDRVPISPRSRSATVGWCWPLTGLGFVKTRQSAILLGSRVNCSNRRAGTHVAHRYSAPQKSLSSLSYLRMSNFKPSGHHHCRSYGSFSDVSFEVRCSRCSRPPQCLAGSSTGQRSRPGHGEPGPASETESRAERVSTRSRAERGLVDGIASQELSWPPSCSRPGRTACRDHAADSQV